MGTRIQQGINNALSQTTFLMGATGVGDKLQQDVVDKNTEAAVARQEQYANENVKPRVAELSNNLQDAMESNKIADKLNSMGDAVYTDPRLQGALKRQAEAKGEQYDPRLSTDKFVLQMNMDAQKRDKNAFTSAADLKKTLEENRASHEFMRQTRTDIARRKLDKALSTPTSRFGRATGAEAKIDAAMSDYNQRSFEQNHNWFADGERRLNRFTNYYKRRIENLRGYDSQRSQEANDTAKSQQEAKSSQKAESREYMASMKKKVMYAAMGLNSNGQTEEDTNE